MLLRKKLIDKIRKHLKGKKPVIGTWQQIPHSSISEILGQAGYDWIAIDMEHGAIGISQVPDLFRAIELGNALPLARVAEATSKDCKSALDAGAGGIIAPMIESSEQLKMVRDACRWPSNGIRGVGFSRANLFGKNFEAYKKEAQSPLLIAQIEHINAANNIEDILQTDGLDAIMIGPYDLSASMGITGKFALKRFQEVIDNIINQCNKHGIPCGDHIVLPDKKLLKKKIDQGYKFIAYGTDGVFINNNCQNPLK